MEQIVCKNLSFSYPESEKKALDNINLTVQKGDFAVICGKSGCGKTTLLRHFKKALSPAGKMQGEVLFEGVAISQTENRDAACKIGFVMQNPENQIVTDKVWHELAFGLENIGLDTASIRLRTAEMAAYFGMNDWFDKKTELLSGGQKQLLSLASVMVMNPEVIILDEPVSQLDPVAAGNFLSTVSKINRELGVTVIMTEHRLEEAFGCANRVIVMDSGRIVADCPPDELSGNARSLDSFVSLSLPAPVRIFSLLGGKGKCPVTVNEGARWLSSAVDNKPAITRIDVKKYEKKENAIEIKNLFFRYEKDGRSVIDNLSLSVPEGSFFALMGGNGAGKSTLLRLLSGGLRPVSGKIKFFGKSAKKSDTLVLALPQDVCSLFTKNSVYEELEEMSEDKSSIGQVVSVTQITDLIERHPYDLSGGEQQRTALAKLLLKKPDILLLDEPTKGMDAEFKTVFAQIINELKQSGKTIVAVSHDMEFCAANADFCSMLSEGGVACTKDANSFFSGNFFYTTAANRMSRHVFENCVTDKDVVTLCKRNIQNQAL